MPPPSKSSSALRLGLGLSLLVLVLAGCLKPEDSPKAAEASGDYLFCFWNTENFFDNKLNGWKREPDKSFDAWFARDREAFAQKLKNLTEVLAALGDGNGPDILALAEVEAESQAADLLVESLNKAIKPATRPYEHILIKNPHGGRDIVTAIVTRLPVAADKTQLLGRRQRILEGHVEVNGQDLVVMATHWTSRVSDERGGGREKYADQIYGRYRAMYRSNPAVSLLVCGDFNDNPDDPSVVEHLHATGDLDKAKADGDPPPMYDLFARLWADAKTTGKGTHFYRGKAYVFDQIVVSPGMVNGKGGWQCKVDTAQVVTHRFVVPRGRNKGHPSAFGTEKDRTPLGERGASDHLPVTVRLTVK
jgi:endonuclease/exonuclease/phosphatase family metal-dependent hydrolase